MVEGANGAGPRWPGRRSSWPPNGGSREYKDPQALERWITQGLERARSELARGDANEAAVSFSTAARKCMERAGIGNRVEAIGWLEQSIEPRMRAIKLYHEVERPIDEARDRSFLGKAFSRLGVMRKDQILLARGVFERTLALELSRELREGKLQADELSYLAEDFRAMGWLETEPRLRSYLYLKSVGYSEAALMLYPRFLMGDKLEARKLHENGFIALAKGYAALNEKDREEVRNARDRCRSLADRLGKCGSDYQSQRLTELARDLDKLWYSLTFPVSP